MGSILSHMFFLVLAFAVLGFMILMPTPDGHESPEALRMFRVLVGIVAVVVIVVVFIQGI